MNVQSKSKSIQDMTREELESKVKGLRYALNKLNKDIETKDARIKYLEHKIMEWMK